MSVTKAGPGYRVLMEGYTDLGDLCALVGFLNDDIQDLDEDFKRLQREITQDIAPLTGLQGSANWNDVFDNLQNLTYAINQISWQPMWTWESIDNNPRFRRILGPDRRILKIGGKKVVFYKMYEASSYKRYFYGILMMALENGDFARLRKCKECQKFFVGEPLNQKFCKSDCSNSYFSKDAKTRMREYRERQRRAKSREDKQAAERRVLSEFVKFMNLVSTSRNTDEELSKIRPILKALGKGNAMKGRTVVSPWAKKRKTGVSDKQIWENLPGNLKQAFKRVVVG